MVEIKAKLKIPRSAYKLDVKGQLRLAFEQRQKSRLKTRLVSGEEVALLLPRLDAATRSEWLLYAPPGPGEYAVAVGALVLYAGLLCAAGLFDFHRRNL